MKHKKKFKIFFIFLLLIFCSLLGLRISLDYFIGYETLIKPAKGRDFYIFSGTLPGLHILGTRDDDKLIKIKFWSFGSSKIKKIFPAKVKNQLCITCVRDKEVFVYSDTGKLLCKYTSKDAIVDAYGADLGNSSIDSILLLSGINDKSYAMDLQVLTFETAANAQLRFKKVFSRSFNDYNPWCVKTGDVDGDGRQDISIGVYKTTKFHPVMAKRPFIYNWGSGEISPKWLGSRLSRPFDNYLFFDIDNDQMDELISIESLSEKKKVINSYKWKGFGFEALGQSKDFEDISDIRKGEFLFNQGFTIVARVKNQNKWNYVSLGLEKDQLAVKKNLNAFEAKILYP